MMKTFKQHILEKLKIGKSILITPRELADRIYDSYDVTNINDVTNSGILHMVYSYFEDNKENLLFVLEIVVEQNYAPLYTVILSDNLYNLFESEELYDRYVGLYRCPRELYDVVSKEYNNPPRVFFMRGVTDWKENTNYRFQNMSNSRNYLDTKNDIYIKLTNGKV